MAMKIGFKADKAQTGSEEPEYFSSVEHSAPVRSVVQVQFPGCESTLSYYNDRFDLRCGDFVFVEGKFAGIRGRVTEVNRNFRIRLSDYKRVLSVADTRVSGRFYMAGSHFVTFDRSALPPAKAATWYFAPEEDDDGFVCGSDDSSFHLNDLSGFKIREIIAKRGHQYYLENRVRYLCIDGTRGYAIVEGTKPYEVEFEYRDGYISGIVCTCPCGFNCKHEFAAMLQLRETLDAIEAHYPDIFNGYFADVYRQTLFSFVLDSKEEGSFVL